MNSKKDPQLDIFYPLLKQCIVESGLTVSVETDSFVVDENALSLVHDIISCS